MLSAGHEYGTFNGQLGGIESSSDDHSSPAAGSQVSSCAVSRRTSIGPHLRSASDDVGHISTSESHENSIVRTKQQCGAEILNFEHLKMQLDKLTGQNKEKQRQSDAESGTSTISPSPSYACFSSQAVPANLPYVGSWPSGLDRTPSIESDVLLPADSGVSSMRSVATDSAMTLLGKCTGVEQKLLTSTAVYLASMQGEPFVSRVGGQQVKHDSSMSSHQHHPNQHHQHVAACHDLLTQPSVVSTCPPAACPPPMNVSNTFSAFQQPGYLCDPVQPPPAYFTVLQQQALLQQMQQQSLLMTQQMQAQHPLMMQCQQVLRLQQQLQQHQQAIQLMQSALLPSQHPMATVPMAGGLTLHNLQWQTQLTNLLIESGLLPAKAHELVQQLQQIMMPSCPMQIPGTSMMQSLTNSGCSVDAFYQLYSHLLLSRFCPGGLPWCLLTSWSSVLAAFAKVIQLLEQPNPLITPELLESMFAQLPPPLNLNASSCLNPGVMFELLCTKFVELLTMQIGQLPVTPMQLTPPVSTHGFFGTSTTSNNFSSSACMSKSATVPSMLPSAEDKPGAVIMDSKQFGTPTKVTRTSSIGLDGTNTVIVTQTCPLHRGASVDSESGDVPGPKVPGIPRGGVSCSRHQNVPAGNGSKMSGIPVPKKNVDCPHGLADLDMALKEKLRPRTTKGMGQAVAEHSKTMTAVTVSSNVVSSVASAPSQSAAASVICDLERCCVTCVNASNGNTISTPRSTSAVTVDTSTVPKLHSASVTKCTAVAFDEKTDAVKKQQVPIVREAVCKAGDVATDTAVSSRLKTVFAVPGIAPLPEVNKDIVKPVSSNICVSVAASSVQLPVAAKSSSQFREYASDHCLPSTSVSLLSLPNSDINRQHVSDSAIASATTHLAQKHLQKKMAVIDRETVSAIDVTTLQPHPVITVSCELYNPQFSLFYLVSVAHIVE